MQTAIKLHAIVQTGGKIEIVDDQLLAGQSVDVIVLFSQNKPSREHSIADVLKNAPGQLAFQSAQAVDISVREERDSWER